jgi:hypothetical protein
MNVFRSLDDELDGNGKAGSHWWIIPFMVTVCFLCVPAVERAGLWPPNDPDFKNCLRNGNGIRLTWQSTERAKPIYLIVRQRQGDGEWETWVENGCCCKARATSLPSQIIFAPAGEGWPRVRRPMAARDLGRIGTNRGCKAGLEPPF